VSTSLITGKALLVIERLDSKYVPFRVDAFIQSAVGGPCARECASEDFGLLATESLPVPSAVLKLKVGDRVRVHVVYEFCYTQDYWGEWDVDLTYHKQRVRRWQPVRAGVPA